MEKRIIGNATLILADCLETLPELEPVDTLITDPPYEVYSREWVGEYLQAVPDHRHNLVFSKQPHTITAQYEFQAWYLNTFGHEFINEYVWYYTDTTTFRATFMPLMHHQTISVFSDSKADIQMDLIREPARRDVASPQFKSTKSRGVELGERKKASTWCPDPRGSWRSSVLNIQRTHSGDLLKMDSKPVGAKPVGVIQSLLPAFAGKVLDPFMGSGTTGVVCAELGLEFIGIEVDENHFESACERIAAVQAQRSLF